MVALARMRTGLVGTGDLRHGQGFAELQDPMRYNSAALS